MKPDDAPYGTRTHVLALRGLRPRPLDERGLCLANHRKTFEKYSRFLVICLSKSQIGLIQQFFSFYTNSVQILANGRIPVKMLVHSAPQNMT